MDDWEKLVESGRAIISVPGLGRAERASCGPNDEKFALGDLLVGVEDDDLERLAHRSSGTISRPPASGRTEKLQLPGRQIAASRQAGLRTAHSRTLTTALTLLSPA